MKNINEADEYILNICKKYKQILKHENHFIKTFKTMYTKNKIKIKEYHLKYLYSKYKQICFPNTLDDF